MRRRIKPIVVYVVLALLGLALVIANIHNTSKQQAHLEKVKSAIPSATTPKTTTSSRSDSSDEELILNPIIDLSGWQLPQDIDYDVLSNYISGAIIRVFGGSQISKDSNAASSNENPAQKPEKTREKVAETAEITKTAPKPSQKAGKDLAKSS